METLNLQDLLTAQTGGLFFTGGIIFTILMIVALWKIFKKMGLPGWMGIIPVLSTYWLYKKAWTAKAFWILAALWVAAIAVQLNPNANETMVNMAYGVCNIAIGVMSLILNIKLSKAFGHGVIFGILLTVISPIFLAVLGFGRSYFRGAPEGDLI